MSTKIHETRHVYLAIGVCIPLFAPILLFFVPQMVSQTLYYSKETWYVFTTLESFVAYGIGFFFLFLAAMLLFFMDIRKLSILLSILCVLISVLSFVVASLSYQSFSNETISYRSLFTVTNYTYSWDEVESITFEEGNENDRSFYKITFSDGNSMAVKNDGQFKSIRTKFYDKVHEMQILINTND